MTERQQFLRDLTQEYGLKEQDIYLLDMIPLIEMIWADGVCEDAEIKLLFDFTVEHLRRVSTWCCGVSVVTHKDVERFIRRFMTERPSQELLDKLHNWVIQSLQKENGSEKMARKQSILYYCMDIAACVSLQSCDNPVTGIVQEEKKLLIELMQQLKIQPELLI